MESKVIRPRAVMHVYQNTYSGALIFYSVEDFIVFFTIFCVTVRKFSMHILALSLMPDHLHVSVVAQSRWELSAFVKEYTYIFSREYNKDSGQKGKFFRHNFGASRKEGDKAIRTNLSYVANNGREKGLCRITDGYQWNFIAYARSDHPFSKKIVLSNASRCLRRSIKRVDYWRENDSPLKYRLARDIFSGLKSEERKQLADYIVASYNVLDYKTLISFYGDYDKMILAFESNQGSEYDITEDYSKESDLGYREIILVLSEKHGFKNVKDVLKRPLDERIAIARSLLLETNASKRQIIKALHLRPVTTK